MNAPDLTASDNAASFQPAWVGDLAAGKRSVHACVSQGELVSLRDGQATLQFTSAFAKERSEKEDYRQIIEKSITQISGHLAKLSCVLASAAPPAAKAAPTAAASPAPAADGGHPALDKALAMFGGKVIKEAKNEEAK